MVLDGTIYLLHFERPYKHAKHYMGWTTDLKRRIKIHRRGRGSTLLRVCVENGITFRVSRTWVGGRTEERRLKNMGGLSLPRVQETEAGEQDPETANVWVEGNMDFVLTSRVRRRWLLRDRNLYLEQQDCSRRAFWDPVFHFRYENQVTPSVLAFVEDLISTDSQIERPPPTDQAPDTAPSSEPEPSPQPRIPQNLPPSGL